MESRVLLINRPRVFILFRFRKNSFLSDANQAQYGTPVIDKMGKLRYPVPEYIFK
jgi:hypothetical protein